MKYNVGNVLTSSRSLMDSQNTPCPDLKIVAILGDYYLVPAIYFPQKAEFVNEKFLDDRGYTLVQPARWVPKFEEGYCYVDGEGFKIYTIWTDTQGDQFRLSIGNFFRVGDTAGIEALKRKWQEGNK